MPTYNLISAKAVIATVSSRFKIDSSIMLADMLSWVGEAVEFIRLSPAMIKGKKELTIKDYRALLPMGTICVHKVIYNGFRLPYGSSAVSHPDPVYSASKTAEPTLASSNLTFTRYESPLVSGSVSSNYYYINGGFLNTSFEKGTVEIQYETIPLDKEGFPKIPDEINYRTAVEYYIMMQLSLRGYTHPVMGYSEFEDRWIHYKNAAYNTGIFPTMDETLQFIDGWTRLIPLQMIE